MKVKSIYHTIETEFGGKTYTIMVYGELSEVKEVNGYYIVPVKYNAKNMKPKQVEFDKKQCVPGFNQFYSRTREFNMGWAICAEPDTFNYEEGVKICKRRFSRSPMTTQNNRFLTEDMCKAIVKNETAYINGHISDFLPKNQINLDDDELMCDVDIILDINDFAKYNKQVAKESCDKIFMVKDECKNYNAPQNTKNINTDSYSGRRFCKYHDDINSGDIVKFNNGDDIFLGIYKGKVYDRYNGSFLRTEFYFLAPISENGLIDHDRTKFFDSLHDSTQTFIKADSDGVKLVNDYLMGAHNKAWDSINKRFKLVF